MRSNVVVQVSFSGQTKNFVPTKPKNKEGRDREYLTAEEVENLVKAVKPNRRALRDEVLIKIMFHHGLGESEAISLKWSEIELDRQRIHVKRVERMAMPAFKPVSGKMLRLLETAKEKLQVWLCV